MNSDIKDSISRFVDSKIYKNISIAISVIIGLTYLSLIFIDLKMIYFIHLTAFSSSFYMIINPMFLIISKTAKDEDVNKREFVILIIISVLIICAFSNIYNILSSGEEVLYLSYKIVGISMICLFIVLQFKKIHSIIKDENKKNKVLAILGSNFIVIFYLALFLIQSDEIFLEQNIIRLEEIQAPDTISVCKHDKNSSNTRSISFKDLNIIKIKDKEIINELVKQLEGKQLENLRGVSYIDYSLKISNKYPYYSITSIYNISTNNRRNLESGYFTYIKLYDNGKTIISEYDREAKEYQRYITYISDDLAKKIISYTN